LQPGAELVQQMIGSAAILKAFTAEEAQTEPELSKTNVLCG
jgi:hypothetical protein